MPATVTIVPRITRRFIPAPGVAVSRRASSGATLEARRAGEIAASRVIVVPRIRDTITVLEAITSAVGGSFSPIAATSALQPDREHDPNSDPDDGRNETDDRRFDQD